jgi:hypothetical protein
MLMYSWARHYEGNTYTAFVQRMLAITQRVVARQSWGFLARY